MSIHVKTADGWQVLGGGSGVDLVGGVAGWAAITEVTGTADLSTLQQANLAPTEATPDDECPGTYNITQDGVEWRVAVWTEAPGELSFVSSGGLLDTLAVSGGGVNSNVWASAGQAHKGLNISKAVKYSIHVGTGGNPAHATSIWDQSDSGQRWIIAANYSGYGAGNYGAGNNGDAIGKAGLFSDITGVNIEYAGGAGRLLGTPGSAAQSPPEPVTSFPGIVVVRSPKDATQPWEPAPELPGIGGWATITGVTGNPTRYTYNDGSMDWVSFEWGVGTNTVTTSGGLLDVLIVGGGLDWPNVHDGGKGGGAVESVTYVESGPSEFFVSDRDPTWTHSWFEKIYVTSPYTWNSGAGSKNSGPEGLVSTIKDGNAIEYGCGGSLNRRDPGCGGWSASPGFAGTCIVRVPLANDLTNGQGSTPASVRAAVEETKQKISNREL